MALKDDHLYLLLEGNASEMAQKLSDSGLRLAVLRANEAILVRKYALLEESDRVHRKDLASLKEEIVHLENAAMQKIGALKRWALELLTG
jgi:hypothetical protein